jgi:hypothetical protein
VRGRNNWFLGGVLMLVLGLVFVSTGWVFYASSTEPLENAEQVTVTVQETRVDELSGDDGYVPEVVYTYEYEGETYRSENLYPGVSGQSYPDREDARAAIEQYESNETATGYVDAENPGAAFLEEPSTKRRVTENVVSVLGMVVGGLITLGSTAMAVYGAAKLDR